MDMQHVHRYLQLFTTMDRFYLMPAPICCSTKQILVIDRESGKATVENIDLTTVLGPDYINKKDYKLVYGFIGTIKLISGFYLIVITRRILEGKLCGRTIFQIEEADMIPYASSMSHLTSRQIEINEKYERMVRLMLQLPGAFFSYSHDLTHTFQQTHSLTSTHYTTKSLLSQTDKRFLWNRYLLKDFTSDEFSQFALPLIQGFISINHVNVNGRNVTWILVSRRSVDRTGARMFVRGIDAQGNVANHVVTEQVIKSGNMMSSFVMTRGSVPVMWTQYPDLTFAPKVNVAAKDHFAPFMKHFCDQERRYGATVCVNLVSHCGEEAVLEELYRTALVYANQRAEPFLRVLKYRSFDFNAVCSSFKYDNLDQLIDSMSKEMEEFGYFLVKDSEVVQRQSGTFRVNCLDCLDRTNVVQSLLAKRHLETVFKQMGIISHQKEILPEFDHLVNNVWADHADMLSIQYSGTSALKTDFTRTGKRTYIGLLYDGFNAIGRYYMNNFTDGFKQDAFDLLLGNYEVQDGKFSNPLNARRSWKYYTCSTVLLVGVTMFCAILILPPSYNKELFLCLMAWCSIIIATLICVVKSGKEFVNWPKLCVSKTYYATST